MVYEKICSLLVPPSVCYTHTHTHTHTQIPIVKTERTWKCYCWVCFLVPNSWGFFFFFFSSPILFTCKIIYKKKGIFLHRKNHLLNEITTSNVVQNVLQVTCYPRWPLLLSFPAFFSFWDQKGFQEWIWAQGFTASRWLSNLEDIAAFSWRSCVLF